MSLIVVESPTKARTFNRILKIKKLDTKYYVFATVGHFRDLPRKNISIDLEHDFKPTYDIQTKKDKMVKELRQLAKEHDHIFLATDPDREGEAIAYHVAYVLGHVKEKWPEFTIQHKDKLKRIIFHEITPRALEEALAHPEDIRTDLVKAQQARRILDRVVGYEVSPLLWKKMGKNWLSAGRVQTVALRLIVEREKEIEKFIQETYFQIVGMFQNSEEIKAQLTHINNESVEIKNKIPLFDGEYEYTKTTIDEKKKDELTKSLPDDSYSIDDVSKEEAERFPPPPYTTSLLQQDAFRRLRFPSKLTMRIAQSLYEKGLITYHRTDSFNLSSKFVFSAKDYIEATYGKEYALEKPRGYKTKSKNAQEAHEAIRPTKAERSLKEIKKKKLNDNERKVYELIYNRALATQMQPAKVRNVRVVINGKKKSSFQAEFQHVLFDGFMKVLMPEYAKSHTHEPMVKKGETVTLRSLEPVEKKTWPPFRYNEASLIRTLEEKSIGRPSTYASIISVIIDKHYVERMSRYLKPAPLGVSLSDYLANGFPDLFNLQFTAEMEDGLDEIANGDKKLLELLQNFYKPFVKELEKQQKDNSHIEVKEDILEGEVCKKCGGTLIAKYGRFGKFYACSNYPKCKYIRPNYTFVNGPYKCPKDGARLVVKYSKNGKRFFGCENYPECKHVQWFLKGSEAEIKGKLTSSK
ncbi:type I DNA topoisomerase [Candidatus Woesebacteria bacterium]|nr:type I DNA topoisomerase [Candidatus Woesebacteria bacterium]